jgi:hypothetical protein
MKTILGIMSDKLSKAGWSWGCVAVTESVSLRTQMKS